MSATPSTPLQWLDWSRKTSAELCLPPHEAQVLQYLAGRADQGGTCFPHVALIAAETRKGVSTVYRVLKALAKRGLVRSRQGGPGGAAIRELVVDARRFVQLSLFEPPASSRADPGSRRSARTAPAQAGVVPESPAPPPAPARVEGCSLTGERAGSHPGHTEVPVEVPSPSEEGGRAGARPLADTLERVLGVLEEAPGLSVSVSRVNDVLCRYPEGDGVDAAREVVLWARRGGLRITDADGLLRSALRKQQPSRRARNPHRGGRVRDRRWSSGEDAALVARMWAYAEAKVAKRIAEEALA